MSKKLGITKQNRGGKPSKGKQDKNRAACLEHYNKYHTATYAAEKTGLNRNTVMTYYKEFSEIWKEQENTDFITTQHNALDKAASELDRRREDLETQLKEITDMIPETEGEIDEEGNKTAPDIQDWSKLQYLRLQVNQQLSKVVEQKAMLDLTTEIPKEILHEVGQDSQSTTQEVRKKRKGYE